MIILLLLAASISLASTTVAPCNKACYDSKVRPTTYAATPDYEGWKRTAEMKER